MEQVRHMTADQFTELLAKIRATGKALDTLIAEGIEWCAYQHTAHKNKAGWKRLIAASPKYATKLIEAAREKCDKVKKGGDYANVVKTATGKLEARRRGIKTAQEQAIADKMAEKAAEKKAAIAEVEAEKKAEATVAEVGVNGTFHLVATAADGVKSVLELTVEEYAACIKAVELARKGTVEVVADQAA